MRIISHRGNLAGPQPDFENWPRRIDDVIDQGFEVEVDIWLHNDKIYLGHDFPEHEVTVRFLESINKYTWFHCKNKEAVRIMTNGSHDFLAQRWFMHDKDPYVAVAGNAVPYLWAYPDSIMDNNCIAVMPETLLPPADKNPIFIEQLKTKFRLLGHAAAGVCTDYPLLALSSLREFKIV